MSLDQNLSVITINYKTKDVTDECLKKLETAGIYCEEKLGNKVEIIVLDNNSSDGSLEYLQKNHKDVKFIASRENTGFGKGNNIAMARSHSPFILLLNSDAFVKEDTLVEALNFFAKNPECDVLGCRLNFENSKLQFSGGFLPNPANTFFWLMGLDNLPLIKNLVKSVHPRSSDFFQKTRWVDWVMGAFFMMRREVFEKTSGFDENLFMYMEEVELCFRIKKMGFKVYYSPEFSITHLDKASSNFELKKPLIKEIQGLLYVFKKYYPEKLGYLKSLIRIGSYLRIFIFSLSGHKNRVDAYREILNLI